MDPSQESLLRRKVTSIIAEAGTGARSIYAVCRNLELCGEHVNIDQAAGLILDLHRAGIVVAAPDGWRIAPKAPGELTAQKPAQAQVWAYKFSVRPPASSGPAVDMLIAEMGCQVRVLYTEADFEEFRAGLALSGWAVYRITRTPYQEPETVA